MEKICGVIGLPSFARACASYGVTIVGGGPFEESGPAISAELERRGAFPVVVGEGADGVRGLYAWVSRYCHKTRILIVRLEGSPGVLSMSGTREMTTPCDLGDVLKRLGWSDIATSDVMDVNGLVSDAADEPVDDEFDPWAEFDAQGQSEQVLASQPDQPSAPAWPEQPESAPEPAWPEQAAQPERATEPATPAWPENTTEPAAEQTAPAWPERTTSAWPEQPEPEPAPTVPAWPEQTQPDPTPAWPEQPARPEPAAWPEQPEPERTTQPAAPAWPESAPSWPEQTEPAPTAPAWPESAPEPSTPEHTTEPAAPAWPEQPAPEHSTEPVAPAWSEQPAQPEPAAPSWPESAPKPEPAPAAPVWPEQSAQPAAPTWPEPTTPAQPESSPKPTALPEPSAPAWHERTAEPTASAWPDPADHTEPTTPNLQPTTHDQPHPLDTYDDQAAVLCVYAGKGGVGKSQPLTTPIPTPNGWTTLGNLTVGDTIYSARGTTTRIDYLSPITTRTTYTITFDNGHTVTASDDHLWPIHTTNGLTLAPSRTLTPGMKIPLPRPIDGTPTTHTWTPGTPIPTPILRADLTTRRTTWNMILDHCQTEWNATMRTVTLYARPHLIPTITELARTFGFHTTPHPTSLTIRLDTKHLTITAITPAGQARVRCLRITDPTHLYLTDGFTPTHNTTTSRNLAERAATRGLKVVLIDSNQGQGDQRTFLRLTNTTLPSIYEVALGQPPATAILMPTTINNERPRMLDPISFSVVLAPPPDDNDTTIIQPAHYLAVVRYARTIADLVIVDTQTVEAGDARGGTTMSDLVIPLMHEGAWALGLTEMGRESMENLVRANRELLGAGCDPTHMLTALSLVKEGEHVDTRTAVETFAPTHFVATGHRSPTMPGRTAAGVIDHNDPATTQLLDTVLHTVTGLQPPDNTQRSKRRFRLFSRKQGR